MSLVDLDLSSLASIGGAAGECRERFGRLDLLVNNAGVMATPYQRTIDGFELQFATDHLGLETSTPNRLLQTLQTVDHGVPSRAAPPLRGTTSLRSPSRT